MTTTTHSDQFYDDGVAPGSECPKCKRKVPVKVEKHEMEPRRPSQVMSIRCPKDAEGQYGEDGIALLKELIAHCGELMPHRDASTPAYFILMDALGWFALSYKPGEDG